MLGEGGLGEAPALLGQPHVAADHLGEAPARQVAERLGHARLRDAQPLGDVHVAARPALGTDTQDCLEVVLG